MVGVVVEVGGEGGGGGGGTPYIIAGDYHTFPHLVYRPQYGAHPKYRR